MSAIYLLIVLALWAWLTKLIWITWRKWRNTEKLRHYWLDAAFLVTTMFWFGVSFWYGGGQKYYWDAKVRELCAKDGGVRVYETVVLPAEKFNQWGQVNFERPTQGENALGPEYLVKEEAHYIKGEHEHVSLVRRHYQVFRRSDGKLLGERISYSRRGGGIPGPWHTPSFSCPDYLDGGALKFIFMKSDTKGDKT